jgi:signal transduction histidine kinase
MVTLRCKDLGTEFRLEVEDQGIGIRAEDQARLFSDFVQLDAGADKKYQGTGLGLSLCKKIVEQMGGRVGLSSQFGQGSLFFAELPKLPLLHEEP